MKLKKVRFLRMWPVEGVKGNAYRNSGGEKDERDASEDDEIKS